MEIVILIGTGVIAVFFWALLILVFCNAKRVREEITSFFSSFLPPPLFPPLHPRLKLTEAL